MSSTRPKVIRTIDFREGVAHTTFGQFQALIQAGTLPLAPPKTIIHARQNLACRGLPLAVHTARVSVQFERIAHDAIRMWGDIISHKYALRLLMEYVYAVNHDDLACSEIVITQRLPRACPVLISARPVQS